MWTDEYWDIQRRAYWGIRRYFARRITPLCSECATQKPDSSKHDFASFQDRLKREEVFLNDILNLLMSLAPQTVYRRIIEEAFARRLDPDETFRSLGTCFLEHFNVGASTTQPDFFALSTKHTFAIELKLGTKSDLRQVLLYAALAAIEEQRSDAHKTHFLLMLTPPRSFTQVWKERFPNVLAFREALKEAALEPTRFAPKQHELFNKVSVASVLPRFLVAHLTYDGLAEILERAIPKKGCANGDETLEKLLSGAAREFRSYGQRFPISGSAISSPRVT